MSGDNTRRILNQAELFRLHPKYKHPKPLKPPPAKLRLTRPEPAERDVLSSILQALKFYPQVARAWRQNTGAGRFIYPDGSTSQFIRFGFPGQPDICGFMRDGRALFIETKKHCRSMSDDQESFLDQARNAGCVAFCARSVDDLREHLQ